MLPLGVHADAVFDPFLILFLALILDAYLGEMRLLFRIVPHPVVALGRLIGWFDAKLNRPSRGEAARRVRGVFTLMVLCALTGSIGFAVQKAAATAPYGWALDLFLLVTLIAQRSLYDHVKAVADGLREGGLAGGRAAVSMIVGRDPNSLDEHGVSRAAIESCAENFSDGVVAPVFWYVIAGLPGIMVYKTVNTLDSMIGHLNPHYRSFGWASARFDDVLNLIPARLAGMTLAVAAVFVGSARPGAAVATMLRDAGKHRSPNAGWPEAAMAGALGLALAGPRRYGQTVVADPWIGSGRARATEQDIRRALVMLGVGCLILWGLVVGLWLVQLSLR
ncbi:adenosylcobinamide-phosphate synthase CbiB [Novispirillum sp. DQ9]|uniref:adenosylcobinamide-phosphate synthase CbiB n=1 Tax=Novispirillum sp. DQ9 TaxID=3398612 RepID=UPI003C7A259E